MLARFGQVAYYYYLELPDHIQQVHNVVHVSLIKQYRNDGRTQPSLPPELVDDCLNGHYYGRAGS